MTVNVGSIEFIIKADTAALLVSDKEVKKAMDNMERNTNKSTESLNRFDKAATQVATSLKMPELNKLSRDMAQLSGKIGANSLATEKAMQTNSKFTGVLSTVSGTIGAGYIGNVGSATETLIKHTRAAIDATAEEVKNAEAMRKQAQAYQAEASQLVLSTQEKRKAAEEAIKLAQSELEVAEALADKKTAHIESMEVLQKEQQYQLKQAELAHQTIGNEKTLAEVVKARSAVQRTQNQIEKQSNAIAQEVWRAEDKVKAAKEAHKKASIELTQAELLEKEAKITSAAADDAATAAKNRATAATKAQAVAMNGLRSVMALFGGPSGILLLAAAGVYALYQAMSDNTSIDDYKRKIDEAVQKIGELTQEQAKALANDAKIVIKSDTKSLDLVAQKIKIIEAELRQISEDPVKWYESNNFKDAEVEAGKLREKLENLKSEYVTLSGAIDDTVDKQDKFNKAAEAGPVPRGDAAKSAKLLRSEYNALSDQQEILNELFTNGAQAAELMAYKLNLENKYAEQGVAITDDIRRSIDDAVASKKQLMETQGAANLKQQLDSIKTNVEALKIEYQQGAKAAAVFRAEQFLSKQDGLDPKLAKEYIEGIKQQYEWQGKVNTKNKESSSSLKNSKKDMEQATNAIQRQRDEIERLNKGYEEGSKKLAQYDAGKALGDKASPQQIAEAERLAGELYDIQQRLADKRAALEANVIAKAEKLKTDELAQIERQLKAGDISFEESQRRRLEIASEYATKIAEATANNIITPVAENRAKFDPVQALQNENTRKLALMREYYNQEQQLLDDSYAKQQMSHEQFTAAKQATDMQYRALITAMDNQYQQQQTAAQWELMRNQSLSYEMLASAVDSFAGNASNVMTGLMTGTMSAADAMRSLGNTILNSVVNSIVQVGVEMLKNFIISKTMGVAAQTANAAAAVAGGAAALAAWTPAAIAASIATGGAAAGSGLASFQSSMLAGQSMSLLGGRRYGGNVSGGNPYRINESGESEIFQTYDGKQAFIPNKSGKVIPADKAGRGAPTVIINLTNNTSAQPEFGQPRYDQNSNTLTIDGLINDIRNGGPVSQTFSQHHNAPRKATGSL
ncbi:hypothetical protein [Providencia rettgeri]|uniref:Tape measure protein n=1 Tax=Providencia rettgeri TaxID=587 RepID=A0AAE3CYW4_PRORE|nr:hypothetical protein [Providencia rettgeri]MBW3118845.1 hypothetical protein [Providencia rettgeri]NHN53872.1 hypothetical protein [Providencia rettgeri]